MISIERIHYYKPHWHDEMLEFAMVLDGSIDAYIGCDSYRMRKGNILLIGTKDVHSFAKTDENNIVLFVRFDCRLLENEFPGITEWNLIGDPAVEELNKADFDRLRFLMAEAAMSESFGGDGRRESVRLLNYCRDTFLSTNLLLRKQDITPTQMNTFQKLASYIQKNYQKPLSLGDAADYINYSFNHASFIIKQITGMSFTDYLNHIRSIAAERMLISTEKSITDIALDCGFSDTRALGRYFKNWYKVTPGEYRNMNNERFPSAGLSSFDELKMNDPDIHSILEPWIQSETRTIVLDMNNHPGGIEFKQPILGHPERNSDYDNIDAVPIMIEGIFENRITKLKQTDDEGPAVFHGDSGLCTYNGIKKAVFHVYDFISDVRTIIRKEDGIIICSYRDGLKILLFPHPKTESGNRHEVIKVILNSVTEDLTIKHLILNNVNGNPFRFWKKLGSPAAFSPEEVELIIRHSAPKLDLAVKDNQSSFELNERMPDEGAVMIEISGRNGIFIGDH